MPRASKRKKPKLRALVQTPDLNLLATLDDLRDAAARGEFHSLIFVTLNQDGRVDTGWSLPRSATLTELLGALEVVKDSLLRVARD